MALRLLCIFIASACLAGCGSSPNAPGVGGVTKAQAEELNQAAADLDVRANAVDDVRPAR